MITSEWEVITPKIAETYLGHNTNNRNIRRLQVARIAADMDKDQFLQTHQGIAFDTEGVLIDGQHRLLAIVASGEPQTLLVSRGLPIETQKYVDRGSIRGTADFVEGAYASKRVAAARLLLGMRICRGDITVTNLYQATRTVTDADIHHLLEHETGIADDLMYLAKGAIGASDHLEIGTAAVLAAAVTFPEVAEESLTKLQTGAGLEVGDPCLALRNYRYRGMAGNTTRMSGYLALKTFLAVSKGKKIKVLRAGTTEHLRFTPR